MISINDIVQIEIDCSMKTVYGYRWYPRGKNTLNRRPGVYAEGFLITFLWYFLADEIPEDMMYVGDVRGRLLYRPKVTVFASDNIYENFYFNTPQEAENFLEDIKNESEKNWV